MTAPFDGMDPETVADVEEAFLAYPADVVAVLQQPYEPGALKALATRLDIEGSE